MATESVRLVNKGDDDFVAQYDRDTYTIPARSEGIVPWEAACLWFGDPRATDTGVQKNRLEEYRRLTVKFGVYDDHGLFDERRPKIEVWRLNGQQVTMLADDPFGPPVDVFGGGGEVDLNTQVSMLTGMVNDLKSKVGDTDMLADPTTEADPDDELPTDGVSAIQQTRPAMPEGSSVQGGSSVLSGSSVPSGSSVSSATTDEGFTLPGQV